MPTVCADLVNDTKANRSLYPARKEPPMLTESEGLTALAQRIESNKKNPTFILQINKWVQSNFKGCQNIPAIPKEHKAAAFEQLLDIIDNKGNWNDKFNHGVTRETLATASTAPVIKAVVVTPEPAPAPAVAVAPAPIPEVATARAAVPMESDAVAKGIERDEAEANAQANAQANALVAAMVTALRPEIYAAVQESLEDCIKGFVSTDMFKAKVREVALEAIKQLFK